MTISTLDAALAGMQPSQYFAKNAPASLTGGVPFSYWAAAGMPGAGSTNGSLNGGTYSSSGGLVTGQIPHYDPGSGNSYLARFSGMASISGLLLLCDRLWDNGGISATSTAAQNITSPTWPARDSNGQTNGAGILLGVEVESTMGNAAPSSIAVSYTNSAGTAGQTATNLDATAANAAVGRFHRMALAAGDVGVRSVQSITLGSSWVSGTLSLVAYRVLAALEVQLSYTSVAIDALTSGFPQLFNGTVPFLIFIASSNGSVGLSGTFVESQG